MRILAALMAATAMISGAAAQTPLNCRNPEQDPSLRFVPQFQQADRINGIKSACKIFARATATRRAEEQAQERAKEAAKAAAKAKGMTYPECLNQPPVSPHPIFWMPRDKWCQMITKAQPGEVRNGSGAAAAEKARIAAEEATTAQTETLGSPPQYAVVKLVKEEKACRETRPNERPLDCIILAKGEDVVIHTANSHVVCVRPLRINDDQCFVAGLDAVQFGGNRPQYLLVRWADQNEERERMQRAKAKEDDAKTTLRIGDTISINSAPWSRSPAYGCTNIEDASEVLRLGESFALFEFIEQVNQRGDSRACVVLSAPGIEWRLVDYGKSRWGGDYFCLASTQAVADGPCYWKFLPKDSRLAPRN